LGHAVYVYTAIFSECAVETQLSSKKKEKVDMFNNKQVMKLFRNTGTPVLGKFLALLIK
jgi:hypothetical protein